MIGTYSLGNDTYQDLVPRPNTDQNWDALLLDIVQPHAPEFRAWPKIPRLFRDITITEKIDGTNACVIVQDGEVYTQSRKRTLAAGDDKFGFHAWAQQHKRELILTLGGGYHYGEWYGRGIQRGYGLKERRFALFNVSRWTRHEDQATENCAYIPSDACGGTLDVVAKVYEGVFDCQQVNAALRVLKEYGSQQVPGFKDPEGVMVYHHAAGTYFKATLDNDGQPKGQG